MYSNVMMLLWERWRRTRIGLAILCLLLVSGLLLILIKDQPVENVFIQEKIGLYYADLILFIVFLNQNEGMNVDLAFPKRLFNYPVSTWILTSTYLLYGIIILSIPLFIVFMFQKLLYGSTSIGWNTLLYIETAYIGLQALCWTGGPARYLYISFSLAALYTIYKIAGSFNLIIDTNILCIIIILFSVIISFRSVSEYRRGNWLNIWQLTTFFSGLFSVICRRGGGVQG